MHRLTLTRKHLAACGRLIGRALMIGAFAVPFVVSKMSTAGFTTQDYQTHVEIDGVNYGSFDEIQGLEEAVTASAAEHDDQQKRGKKDAPAFRRVSFKRDFVTDPSLYLWAKNIMHGRSDLKDVHVVSKNRDGEELSRYVLRFCQPLSWTVEAANPALGGFHEKIDLAVQEIAVY